MRFFTLWVLCMLMLVAVSASSVELASETSQALAVRAQCSQGGQVFNEIANGIIVLLPMLQPILMAAGVGEIVPFVVLALKVIEMLHLFFATAQSFHHVHDMAVRRSQGQCAKYPALKNLHDTLKSRMPTLHEKLKKHKLPNTSDVQVNETMEAIQHLFHKVREIWKMIGSIAKLLAGKHIENVAHQFEPEVCVLISQQDPYYEFYEDHGRMKRRKRPMPPGLTKKEEKILRKIKKRAHHLDKGFRLCGVRFGWTFIIGLIPFAGDIADGLLSHYMIVKKAQQIDGFGEAWGE
ncbi:hypothetical protein MNAN1_000062 [Malassezia nana]|uniref:Uncharacterized protein n=1 Tax=Malassezia nana TaxID=180528 RepID=A0AAF0EGK7_9BASI|nr:hypothetical protein MNAN1_000062 [Malassezia nana]